MRAFIFTEREREILTRWLETGEENYDTARIFTWIRQRTPQLAGDMTLILAVIRQLQKTRRWRGRTTGSSEFGSALRLAGSALTRARGASATSSASRP